jgi:hypothetical protein
MTQGQPDITCTKCSTVVPWGPHCPHCRAYLEFSGIPPWHPTDPEEHVPVAAQTSDEIGDGAEPDEVAQPEGVAVDGDVDSVEIVDVSHDASVDMPVVEDVADDGDVYQAMTESILIAEAITGAPAAKHGRPTEPLVPRPPGPWRLLFRGWRRQPQRNLVASVFAVMVALLVVALLAAVSGSHAAWISAPLFVIWALVAVATYGTIPDERERGEEPEPEEEAIAEPMAVTEDIDEEPELILAVVEDEDRIRSREPQLVAATVEKSKPMLSATSINRDVACDQCGHLNLRGASYCASCVAVLPGAQVAPDVIAYSLVDGDDADDGSLTADGKRKQRRRRITGSWRNAIVALTLIGIVVGAFVFAFFGPGAMRVQFGMVQAFQLINQWIDPYTGSTATVNNVTASSSLMGTSDSNLKDADSRTFWASAALPNYGSGTSLTFTFDEPSFINRMVIYPGVQNLQFDRRALATPRDFTLTFDNGSSVAGTLNELSSSDEVRQLVKFPDVLTKTVVVKINSVYAPLERNNDNVGEVAVSGVDFLKVPQAPAVFRFQQGSRIPGLPGMNSQ